MAPQKEVMIVRTCICLALLIGLTGVFGCTQPTNPEAEKAAESSARAWLGLVDDGKYTESWETAAGYFKNAVGKEEWGKQLSAVRKPLGKMMSREIRSKKYRTSLPGAPDGEYVIIQYKTSFKNKKHAIETVTPMQDEDGEWRVSGYYIK